MATKRTKPRIQVSAGTVLTHRRRDGTLIKATVVEGGVRTGGKDYRSINAAAMASGGGKAVDAWRYWRLEDGRLLDALRGEPRTSSTARARGVNVRGANERARGGKRAKG